MIYRPAPRVALWLAMAFLLAIGIPPMVLVPLGWNTLFAALFVGAFVGFLATLAARKVVLRVDDASRSLVIEDQRWPLSTVRVSVPVGDIAGTEVLRARTYQTASNAVRVEIVLHSGDHVPVTTAYWGPGARHERVATWIRTLCPPGGSNTP